MRLLVKVRNSTLIDSRRYATWRTSGRRAGTFIAVTLLVLIFLLSACATESTPSPALAEAPPIPLAALPVGVGRGFPTVEINQTDANNVGLQKGNVAPNFRLVLADGRHINLQDLQGQPVLINFWATWCGPCRLEMPEIVSLAATNADLVVLAINVQESIEQIQPFAEEFQMTLPVVRDTDGSLRNLYEVRGMPTSIFIDRNGKIFTTWAGMLTMDLLQEIVADLG